MSITEAPREDPNPNEAATSPERNPNEAANSPVPETDAGTLDYLHSVDPLLKSGAFIDTPIHNEDPIEPKEEEEEEEEIYEREDGSNRVGSPGGSDMNVKTETENGADPVTPAAAPVPLNSKPLEDSETTAVPATPDWLPPDWTVHQRVRISGATAGTVDKYYVSPEGRRFRSKVEVLSYLETGRRRKRKPKDISKDTAAPDTQAITTPEDDRPQKIKVTKKPTRSVSEFDYAKVPEKVSWVMTDSSAGMWTPSVGDEKVPDSVKQDWDSAFASVVQNRGQMG